MYIHLINIEQVSKHSVTILGLCVVTPAGLELLQVSRVGKPAHSMFGVRRPHCSVHPVHTVNDVTLLNYQ